MGKTGRLYPPEFKEEAVRLVKSSDEKYPVSKIARDSGCRHRDAA
jgi:transposase-like protein